MHESALIAISTLISGGIAVTLAKSYVKRKFDDIETVSEKVSSIKEKIAVIELKLEQTSRMLEMLHEHEIKIVKLEQPKQKEKKKRVVRKIIDSVRG